VGDSDEDFADAQLLDDVFDAAADGDGGLAARLVADFHVAPRNAPAPAGAQGFEDGLFAAQRPVKCCVACLRV